MRRLLIGIVTISFMMLSGSNRIWAAQMPISALPQEAIEASDGRYLIGSDGNLYLRDTEQSIFVDGIGSDGYLYDPEGRQKNTLSYIRDKYWPMYEQTALDEYVPFDSVNDAKLFMLWYQFEFPYQVGRSYSYVKKPNDETIYILKKMFEDRKVEMGPDYTHFIQTTAAHIRELPDIKQQLNYAASTVAAWFDYDETYVKYSMKEAFQDRKAVCYHYSSLLHSLLSASGLQSECLAGDYSQTGFHAWNRVYDPEENCYYYADATHLSHWPTIQTSPQFTNAYYLSKYRMITLFHFQ